jgi:hypothetical protein
VILAFQITAQVERYAGGSRRLLHYANARTTARRESLPFCHNSGKRFSTSSHPIAGIPTYFPIDCSLTSSSDSLESAPWDTILRVSGIGSFYSNKLSNLDTSRSSSTERLAATDSICQSVCVCGIDSFGIDVIDKSLDMRRAFYLP